MQWLEACERFSSREYITTHGPYPIESVFRLRVSNPTTTAVTQRVIANRGHQTFTSFPGVTFDTGSEEGKTISGTPNGAGVAWLLIQRKQELGHGTIKDVTVFWAEYEGMSRGDCPRLLFRIESTGAHEEPSSEDESELGILTSVLLQKLPPTLSQQATLP